MDSMDSMDSMDKGIAKAGEADAAIAPPTRTPITATFGTLRYHGVLQSEVGADSRNQVSHLGMGDSGKATKFLNCPPKATQTN